MTDSSDHSPKTNMSKKTRDTRHAVNASLKRRYLFERCFRGTGLLTVGFGLLCLTLLLIDIISRGQGAFFHTRLQLTVDFSPSSFVSESSSPRDTIATLDYEALYLESIYAQFPQVQSPESRRALRALFSPLGAYDIRDQLKERPTWLGSQKTLWVTASSDTNQFYRSKSAQQLPEDERRITDQQAGWISDLVAAKQIKRGWNRHLFSSGDSRQPEMSGVASAVIGSLLTMIVTFVLSFPIGIAAAIYLEEYAPTNRFTDIIEVNINNLAAVPPIIFGLLGLALFINTFGLPRSAPLVAGLVLTLMTLPTIIITSRAAIKTVPRSLREAALGMGASRMQMVFHHILPLAMPGMLTGAIIGMAQALGEAAPLLLVGMVAFTVDAPNGIMDTATALPVQIFQWADSPESAFLERASAAIIVLLIFLISMNLFAVWLRKRLEQRW